jgi:uncharacterized membrane protein
MLQEDAHTDRKHAAAGGTMLRVLTGLVWLLLASGILSLLLSQRSRLGLRRATEPGEPGCYRWGFYVNPDDARLFVRDVTGFGWALNLGHRAAVGVLIASAGTPFAVIFLVSALHS